MKIFLLFFISCLAAMLSSVFNIYVDVFIITTLYNAMCIVFSVGMGIIVTFPLDGIKNIKLIKEIRANIKMLRNKFIVLFVLCTIFLIVEKYFPNITIFSININNFLHVVTMMFFILSIGYFVYNFTKIQKLKDEIFDRILKEGEKFK